MANFDFEKMQEIQKELQEKYKDKWTPMLPQFGKNRNRYIWRNMKGT